MILPTKHLDLDTCVLHCAAMIVAILRDESPIEYDVVLRRLQMRVNERTRFQFPYALDFLYLLEAIDYDLDTDSLLLTARTEKEAAA
ncbi:MAG: hypothetical protein GY835_02945 [bacterium]|nr:hypothetical protein [bacterium]